MGYKKREWWPGAILHITARGNHRNDIFRDKEDFQVYYTFLEEAIEHFERKFEIYSYCLMDNHVHILLKTGDLHICNLVSRIHSIYARFFNNKYKYVGHLFQDRYYTEVIENDAQLLSTSRYIHLNPIRAKMVEKPEDYEWSSYGMTIGVTNEKLINSEAILSYFKKGNSRELYKSFVESAMKDKCKEDDDYGVSS
ncbi:transposase [Clostridium sp.]|uniref:transposase n=1 Tax=Clostridium sp. TaxID=1506 RepID=UPI00260ED0E1|nr:transposase [Clostridium sp.]